RRWMPSCKPRRRARSATARSLSPTWPILSAFAPARRGKALCNPERLRIGGSDLLDGSARTSRATASVGEALQSSPANFHLLALTPSPGCPTRMSGSGLPVSYHGYHGAVIDPPCPACP